MDSPAINSFVQKYIFTETPTTQRAFDVQRCHILPANGVVCTRNRAKFARKRFHNDYAAAQRIYQVSSAFPHINKQFQQTIR
jgi:hypothetical protein